LRLTNRPADLAILAAAGLPDAHVPALRTRMKASSCQGVQGRPDDERERGHRDVEGCRLCHAAGGNSRFCRALCSEKHRGKALTSRATWGVLLDSGGARLWRGEQINAATLRSRTGARSSGKPERVMSRFEQMRLNIGLPASARRSRGRVGNSPGDDRMGTVASSLAGSGRVEVPRALDLWTVSQSVGALPHGEAGRAPARGWNGHGQVAVPAWPLQPA
jgi:hypothetical protein